MSKNQNKMASRIIIIDICNAWFLDIRINQVVLDTSLQLFHLPSDFQ